MKYRTIKSPLAKGSITVAQARAPARKVKAVKTRKARAVKIKHVTQEHDKGCVIACIAMVLGVDYKSVVDDFQNDFEKKGIKPDIAKDFICEHGYSVIEKRGTGYLDVRQHNRRMLEPFAPIHIVTVQQFADLPKHNHSFVMDAKGKVYEPSGADIKEVLYYAVINIMGFFDDRITHAESHR